MGLFNFFSKKKQEKEQEEERLRNQVKAMTIEELAEVLDSAGTGVEGEVNRYLNYSKNELKYRTYLEKLIYNSVKDGGFGGNPNIRYDCEGYFYDSILSEGSLGSSNMYGQRFIRNYKLEFLRNYIQRGNTRPLKREWMNLIFRILDGGVDAFGKADIKNVNHDIYHPWVYKGGDDFVTYKIKLVVFINNPSRLDEFGLFRPDENGKPSNEYITIEDLVDIDNMPKLESYISSLQTRNLD